MRFLSPLCLLLALAMLIAGFALWSVDAPEAGIELHRARVEGDDDFREVLEAKLEQRRMARSALLFCLFGGSAMMALAAFATLGRSS
ncbi:MAG: hypothetical protein H6822_10050 [Planctomycetaceae bacterium]|nr:hypothetical protein [Planctomycetales bacterium]MCB9922514.1 hypothetical protein [Planctomycetaceae bacterium]